MKTRDNYFSPPLFNILDVFIPLEEVEANQNRIHKGKHSQGITIKANSCKGGGGRGRGGLGLGLGDL